MGNKIAGINLSGIIKKEIGNGVLADSAFDATLTKYTPGTRSVGDSTGGTNPTSASYSCKGMIDSQATANLPGTLVEDGVKVILLIGDTIDNGNPAAAPSTGDEVTIEGTTYVVGEDGSVDRDPAAATYTLKVRPV